MIRNETYITLYQSADASVENNVILFRESNATIRALSPMNEHDVKWEIVLEDSVDRTYQFPYYFSWIDVRKGRYVAQITFSKDLNDDPQLDGEIGYAFFFGWKA